jgi:hypothetical protein
MAQYDELPVYKATYDLLLEMFRFTEDFRYQKLTIKITLITNETLTRMVGLIAFGRPDSFVINPKVYSSEFKATYQTFGTLTTTAAVNKVNRAAGRRTVVMPARPNTTQEERIGNGR